MRWQVAILCVVFTVSVFAPILAPHDPMRTEPTIQMQPPTRNHIFGTDMLGRDVFSRFLLGGQRSLFVAIVATCIAVICGTGLGILSGTTNNMMGQVLSSITSTLLAFPNLLLGMVVLTILGVGLTPLIIATGFAQIAPVAYVIRSAVIQVSVESFVESGYAIGATRQQIVRFYILPNIQGTLWSYATIIFSYCLLNSAALSYFGLGGEPGIPDWGVMLAEGRTAFRDAPWIAIAPGLAITIIVWSINSLVDKLMLKYRRSF